LNGWENLLESQQIFCNSKKSLQFQHPFLKCEDRWKEKRDWEKNQRMREKIIDAINDIMKTK